jgi:hypothetical protein
MGNTALLEDSSVTFSTSYSNDIEESGYLTAISIHSSMY